MKPGEIHVTRKKSIALGLLFVLLFIFAIGNYGTFKVYGDYNTTFSHTRTPIFTDTQFNGPQGFQRSSVQKDLCSSPCTSGSFTVTSGDRIMVHTICFTGSSNVTGVTDSLSNSYSIVRTQQLASSSQSRIWTTFPAIGGSDTVTVTASGCSATHVSFSVNVYANVASLGTVDGKSVAGNFADSGSDFMIETVGVSTIYETFDFFGGNALCGTITAGSGQTIQNTFTCFVFGGNTRAVGTSEDSNVKGPSNTFTMNWAGFGTGSSNEFYYHMIVEMGIANPNPVTNNNVRWNFNSTCVTLLGPTVETAAKFDYSQGSSGTLGNNCSSADIIVSKAPANLQIAAGRMVEIVMSWNPGSVTQLKNVTMILRTNGTLPGFKEGYNPFNDPQARLLWSACPIWSCASGFQAVYIVRDTRNSANQEGLPNDLVINATAVAFKQSIQSTFQTVLNFTGPSNFLQSINATTSQNSASALQMGQDYYILAMATFDTTQSPCASCAVRFTGNQSPQNGSGDPSLGIWSVPSSCNDQVNKTACGFGTTTPVFNIDPLDPSSWANAIIKGLTWIFLSAIPQGALFAFTITIAETTLLLNLVGTFFGLGNVGTLISQLISEFVTFFSGSVPTLFTRLTNIWNLFFQTLTFIFPWLPIAFNTATTLLTLAVNGMIEIPTIVGAVFQFVSGGFAIYAILFWFVYTGDDALGGAIAFIETTEWLVFGIGVKYVTLAINLAIDIVTGLIGLIPKPFIHMYVARLGRLPIVDSPARFVSPSFNFAEIANGNAFSALLWMCGFTFLDWYESVTPALPGSLGQLLPSTLSSLVPLSGFLPLLLMFTALTGAAVFLTYPLNMMAAVGLDLRLPISASAGRRLSSGPSGVRLTRAGKHFQGRLEGKIAARQRIEASQRDIETRREAFSLGERGMQRSATERPRTEGDEAG